MNIKKLMKASTTAEEINQLDKDIIKIEALAEKVAQGLLVNNLKFDFSENPRKEDPKEDYEKLIKGIFEERLRGVFQIKSTSLEGDNKKEVMLE